MRGRFLSSSIIICVAACVPPPTQPGPKYYTGDVPLVLVNKGKEPVCDVQMMTRGGSIDNLVCSPVGVKPQFQSSGYDVCKGPCLAPGESRSMTIGKGKYTMTGWVGERLLSTPARQIQTATEVWWNVASAPKRSPAGRPVVVGWIPPPGSAGPPGGEPTGPCIPSGQQVMDGRACCDGWSVPRPDGPWYCTTENDGRE